MNQFNCCDDERGFSARTFVCEYEANDRRFTKVSRVMSRKLRTTLDIRRATFGKVRFVSDAGDREVKVCSTKAKIVFDL